MKAEIKPVRTKGQQKEFMKFPLDLYKGNPYFVPPLWMDEKKIFSSDYSYYDTCKAEYFLAYDSDGKVVGRISGIIQGASNAKNNEKRVRFDRFDCIEDFEVAKALFAAVEEWALAQGMDTACGPLGFSDLEREGLLVDGFDQLSTFEEQYNAPYYADFIERLGYVKEVGWLESKIRKPDPESYAEMKKMAEFVMRRYKLRIAPSKNGKDFVNRYLDGFFDIVDRSYEKLYGTVPFTENMKKTMVENFNLIIDNRYAIAILDENERVICIGVCFPSLARALQKSGGRLTPCALLRLLKAIRHPEIIDLGLIGVDPEYLNRGVSAIVCWQLATMLQNPRIKWAETNLNLEDNDAILNMWKRFDSQPHKKRNAYVKKLV